MYNKTAQVWQNNKCDDACYYSKNADFKKLFDKLEISKIPSYFDHLNKHNVIYMTFNEFPKKIALMGSLSIGIQIYSWKI